ncbi:MAG: hypothetical protein JKY99_02405 [Rhizobiales bacterium]|nr:hypothetical protein [Hyphomicrobiales bacterium]
MIKTDKDNPEWTEEMFKRSKPASSLPEEVLAVFPKTLHPKNAKETFNSHPD